MTVRGTVSAAEEDIAKRYAAEGYEVVREPPPDLLPPSVKPYAPDLVARRGEERVAIEIVARPDAARIERLKQLAIAYRAAGWRLDVVVLGSPLAESEQPRYLPDSQLRERLRAAELTARAGDRAASLVLVWTVIEASLRQLIGHITGETSPMTLPRLIKEALSLGILSQREWVYLNELLAFRNRVVHGEDVVRALDKRLLDRARKLAIRLVDRLSDSKRSPAGRLAAR